MEKMSLWLRVAITIMNLVQGAFWGLHHPYPMTLLVGLLLTLEPFTPAWRFTLVYRDPKYGPLLHVVYIRVL